MKFKVGDRVKYIGEFDEPYGKIGVIKYVYKEEEDYAVEFKNFEDGHDCCLFNKAYAKSYNGWWCKEHQLKLLKPKSKKITNWKSEMKI